MFSGQRKAADQVFGVSPKILPDSYIDRGSLDAHLRRELGRSNHLALRGESKCGKSWLRQKIISNAIVIQCRLKKPAVDVYTDILSQLEVRLTLENAKTGKLRGTVEATGSLGASILGKIGLGFHAEDAQETTEKSRVAGHTVDDLKFIADIIKSSGRRIIIEDFHYMSLEERCIFAHDLKTFWDFGIYFIIVGVWTQTNMLLSLNGDLSNRIREIPIVWSERDFYSLIDKGSSALGISFSEPIRKRLVSDSFGNVAILQRVLLSTLDKHQSSEVTSHSTRIDNINWVESAELEYAEELDALYQVFAKRVAANIKTRRNSTGINAHTMAVILESSDVILTAGLSIDRIFEVSHGRQSRIQKGNLRTALENFESRQIDQDGKGLVFSYNEHSGLITIVDKQLLFYRKFSTHKWPWDEMIKEAEESGTGYEREESIPKQQSLDF